MKKSIILFGVALNLFFLAGCTTKASDSFSSNSSSGSSSSSSKISVSSSSSSSQSSSSSLSSSSSIKEKYSKEKIIELLQKNISNQTKVKSASIQNKNDYSTTTTNYEFGTDKYGSFVYISDNYSQKYYGLDANGNAYGLQISSNMLSSVYENVTNDMIFGPAVSFYDYSINIYGVEGLLNEMKSLVVENKNLDLELGEFNENFSSYSFTIGKAIKNTYTNEYSLFVSKYSIKTTNDIITSLVAEINKYSSTDITADYEKDGVYLIKDGATPTKTSLSYTQVIGERTLNNPYDIEALSYSSYSLKDSNGNVVTDSFSFNAGLPGILNIDSFLPSTADGNVDKIAISEKNNNTNIYGYATNGQITLSCQTAGDYVVVLKSRKIEKTINVKVETPLPESLSVFSYIYEGKSYNSAVIENEITTYKNVDVYFSATISPSKANQKYSCSMADNPNATLVEDQIKLNSWDNNTTKVYKFNSSSVGEYSIIFKSAELDSITKTITIKVVENPNTNDILSKKYVNASGTKIYQQVIFAPSASDTKIGTAKIDDILIDKTTYAETTRSNTVSYAYNEETRSFILSGENSDLYKLYFSGDYKLVLESKDTNGNTNVVALSEFSCFSMLRGGLWSYFNDGEYLSIEFATEKSGLFSYNTTYNLQISFVLKEEDDKFVVELSDSSLDLLERECEISIEEIYTDKSVSNVHVKFTKGVDVEVFDYSLTKGRG